MAENVQFTCIHLNGLKLFSFNFRSFRATHMPRAHVNRTTRLCSVPIAPFVSCLAMHASTYFHSSWFQLHERREPVSPWATALHTLTHTHSHEHGITWVHFNLTVRIDAVKSNKIEMKNNMQRNAYISASLSVWPIASLELVILSSVAAVVVEQCSNSLLIPFLLQTS